MRSVQHDIKYTAEKSTFELQLDLCKRIVCRRSGDPFYSTGKNSLRLIILHTMQAKELFPE